jgi:hypothetical protein
MALGLVLGAGELLEDLKMRSIDEPMHLQYRRVREC